MSWMVEHAGLADQGRNRPVNEDHWCADPRTGLYAITDGMGGVAGGGLAAKIVVETLPTLVAQCLARDRDVLTAAAKEQLSCCLTDLSLHLRHNSRGELGLDGMGSTVVVTVVRPPGALIAHMGNSRAYLSRQGTLRQLTEDHTLIHLLVGAREITAREAEDHPSRGQLTRYVGMPDEPLPEVQCLEVKDGDRLLLCSDGLTEMVSDGQIRGLLQEAGGPQHTCRRLVDTANAAGGNDNIAVVLISIQQQDK